MLNWPRDASESHEDLFIERYQQLLSRARHLTGGSRDRAEDLVHEAFVQFVLARPDLSSIQHLDSYLYGMLRNLHLSQARRAVRGPVAWLSAIDYDTAEIGLREIDVARRLEIQGELVAILRFADARKRTSKSGSVLLLRFFHGYYPDEIGRMLGGPSRAADDWLRLARREARASLEAGGAVPDRLDALTSVRLPSSDDFLLALRAAIFAAPDGDCDRAALAESYRSPTRRPVPTRLLAHLVSCRGCLECVNAMLGLPPLSDRYPTDTLGPGGRTPPAGGSPGVADRGERVAARRLEDTRHHRPKELRVFTNGFHVATQTIVAPETDQSFSVPLAEPIAFVEVFSEQGLRLALLPVTPPPAGDVEQRQTVTFSGDRTLDLRVGFDGSWPTIRTTYCDPLVAVGAAVAPTSLEESRAADVASDVTDAPPAADRGRLVGLITRALAALVETWRAQPQRVLTLGVATVVVAAVAIWWRGGAERVSGDVLLARAALVESAADPAASIVHRTLVIEEPGASPASRERLEIWRDTVRRRTVRRLFDSANRLVAAEWTSADGAAVVYARDATPAVRRLDAVAARQLVPTEVWRAASASDLAAVLPASGRLSVADVADAYIVGFSLDDRPPSAWLTRATLRIRKTDSHLVEGRLTVLRASRPVEYRVIEVSFDRVDDSRVPASVFTVDPDVERLSRASVPDVPAAVRTIPTTLAAVQLELSAVQALHDAGACLGEQIAVVRTADGVVRIDGVVDDDDRRRALMRALAPLRDDHGLELQIASGSGGARRDRASASAVRHIDVGPGQSAAHDTLVQHFASAGSAPADVEQLARAFAERTLDGSRRVLLHAWAMKRLTEEFRPDVLRAVGRESYARWLSLIAEHADRYREDLEALRRDIATVIGRDVAPVVERSAEAGEQWSASERVLALTVAIDADLRAAFAVSTDATASALQSEAFWQRVDRALATARTLGHRS